MPFVIGKEIKGEARLTISAPQGGSQDPGVTISVTDDVSLTEALELNISREDLMRALMGHGNIRCQATWRTDKLGYKREHKTEEGVTEENVASFEVSGWVARRGDLRNGHRRSYDKKTGKSTYSVVFERWVPVEESDEEQ